MSAGSVAMWAKMVIATPVVAVGLLTHAAHAHATPVAPATVAAEHGGTR